MANTPQGELAGEIAYVKSLAEEGRNAPLVGGVIYVIWGVVVGLASLLGYLHYAEIFALPFAGTIWFWIAALGVGWAASVIIGRRSATKPGALTVGNKTAGAAWFAVGVFMTIFWIATLAFQGHFRLAGMEPKVIFGLMFPIAFGLYGVAFYATAIAARLDWMRGFAFAAWIFSIASFYFLGDAKQLLVGAAGSVVCALLPGVLLMRREPSDIV